MKRYDLYLSYWIRKWKFFVIFFLAGTLVTSAGAVLYYSYVNFPSYSANPYYQGFGIARNSTVLPSMMVIGLSVAPAEFSFQYFFITQTDGTYNFIFVFPFQVINTIERSENMSFVVNSTNTCSIVSVILNCTAGMSQQIWGNFVIDQTFISGSRGLYTIVLPFGGGVGDQTFNEIQEKLQVGFYNPGPIELYVSLPNSYSWTESFPSMSGMNPFVNPVTHIAHTSLHWKFDNLQDSVTIKCEDQFLIGLNDNLPFWSGIFLGIGTSLIITSFYDGLKKWSEKTEER